MDICIYIHNNLNRNIYNFFKGQILSLKIILAGKVIVRVNMKIKIPVVRNCRDVRYVWAVERLCGLSGGNDYVSSPFTIEFEWVRFFWTANL